MRKGSKNEVIGFKCRVGCWESKVVELGPDILHFFLLTLYFKTNVIWLNDGVTLSCN